MAVVSQEPVLFADTIGSNISYGFASATPQQIRDAAAQANALQFIESFPDGMDTQVGERGLQVSGGQRQRLAIARAIIKNPAILILDEATSALDNESDRLVRDALQKLMQGRSTLLIAHRASTIQSSTRVAVLAEGVVAEQGSYKQLIDSEGGVFKALMDTLPA